MTWREVKIRVSKWSAATRIKIYLDGVSSVKEYIYYTSKMKSVFPVGIYVSSLAQLVRIRQNLGELERCVSGYLINYDDLFSDGINVDIPLEDRPKFDFELLRLETAAHLGVIFQTHLDFMTLYRVGRYVDEFITTFDYFIKSVMAKYCAAVLHRDSKNRGVYYECTGFGRTGAKSKGAGPAG
jgi:hypothetical protein